MPAGSCLYIPAGCPHAKVRSAVGGCRSRCGFFDQTHLAQHFFRVFGTTLGLTRKISADHKRTRGEPGLDVIFPESGAVGDESNIVAVQRRHRRPCSDAVMLMSGLPPVLANATNAAAIAPGHWLAALADRNKMPPLDSY